MRKVPTVIITMVIVIITLIGIVILTKTSNKDKSIMLATTTSTDNSGLLDFLHPIMEDETGISVDILAVGTGAALEQSRRGLADVILVHARTLEDQFIAEGFGFHRVDLMFNDFIIIGPTNDPANIAGLKNSTEIFIRLFLARDSITFVSRGDNSGTHVKELELWKTAGVTIKGKNLEWGQINPWYIETGSGMGYTLTVAYISEGYTLIDRGTWLFNKRGQELMILAEGPPEWLNYYGAILVNPDKFNSGIINFKSAKEYVKWLISNKGQALINNYTINDEQAFYADFTNHVSEMSPDELKFWGITTDDYLKVNEIHVLIEKKKKGMFYGK
ncbi:MAG: substrate-binding domain-containing protein [Candidatus Hodarchaeales archaeon]